VYQTWGHPSHTIQEKVNEKFAVELQQVEESKEEDQNRERYFLPLSSVGVLCIEQPRTTREQKDTGEEEGGVEGKTGEGIKEGGSKDSKEEDKEKTEGGKSEGERTEPAKEGQEEQEELPESLDLRDEDLWPKKEEPSPDSPEMAKRARKAAAELVASILVNSPKWGVESPAQDVQNFEVPVEEAFKKFMEVFEGYRKKPKRTFFLSPLLFFLSPLFLSSFSLASPPGVPFFPTSSPLFSLPPFSFPHSTQTTSGKKKDEPSLNKNSEIF
jgi:hypothetical protein